MTTNTLPTIAAGAAIALLLTSCTTPAAQDPAAAAAVAYYTSIDNGTTDQCDLTWAYRESPERLAACKQNPGGGQRLLLEPPAVLRVIDWTGSPTGKGKAVVTALKLKTYAPRIAFGMDQDTSTGKWLMVDEGEITGDVDQDANVLGALQ